MDRLYLLRHGIAVPRGSMEDDDERRLTPKGEKRVRQVARGLRQLELKLDRLLTSPVPRARRTAEIVAETLGIEYLLEPADALRPGASAASIRDWLRSRSEARVMIVGHDPSFSTLVGLLTTGQESPPVCTLRKGGIAALRSDPDGRFRLDWLARPRLIRRLAD